MVVDVTGIEPVTPRLQSKLKNVMWLILLAFTYVMEHGLRGCLELIVPILFPSFPTLRRYALVSCEAT
jgi:hypothetical protein